MAAQDSTVPAETEKGYSTQGQNMATGKRGSRLKVLDILFRFLVFASTLCAFVIMITNLQTKQPFLPASPLKFYAKYYYSSAFIWFVVANCVAFTYALLTLLSSTFMRSPKLARFMVLLDLLIAFIVISGASAATAVAYIGQNGLSQAMWPSICKTFTRYCSHVFGALFCSFIGWLNLTILVILGLHRS